MSFNYKFALITGGSSGIGWQLAKDLAELGVNLLLVSNEKDRLSDRESELQVNYPKLRIEKYYCNLNAPGACEELLDFCSKNNCNVDLLVNNAGFGSYGFVKDTNMERELEMMHLNMIVVYKMTRLFMSEMIGNNHGCIVNLSSISAFQPNPKLATYGATKTFILNWSRALAEEMKMLNKKVKVITICPTPVTTDFQKNAKMMNSTLYDSWMTVTPEMVSKEIIRAIKHHKLILVPGKRFHLANVISSRLPIKWKIFLAKLHMKEKDK